MLVTRVRPCCIFTIIHMRAVVYTITHYYIIIKYAREAPAATLYRYPLNVQRHPLLLCFYRKSRVARVHIQTLNIQDDSSSMLITVIFIL